MADRIREVPVQRKRRVGHQRIDSEMKSLDRLPASRHAIERRIELCQVAHLDHQVELAEARWRQAKLAPGQPPALDQALLLQVPEIGSKLLCKGQVADPGLQVAPDVVNVHAMRMFMRSGRRRYAADTPAAGTTGHTRPGARAIPA